MFESMKLVFLITVVPTKKERKLDGSAFLTRWGHSSAVYNGNIYIFGGRFSNDLNDVLVFDL